MNTQISITLHAASKAVVGGFVPMVLLRNAKGQMIGSRTPEAPYREFRTFTTEAAAKTEAQAIVERMAALYPEALRLAPVKFAA